MAKHQVREIAVTEIDFDLINARVPEQSSQHEALLALISDQGEKLATLAADIGSNGLSPIDRFLVVKHDGRYISAEGNRRLAALRMLVQPALASGTDLERRFADLHKQFGASVPRMVECVVTDRKTADVWVERKHDKGMKGAGVEGWNATAKNRFVARHRGDEPWVQKLIDHVRGQPELSHEEKAVLDKRISISTIQRVVKDRNFRTALGYAIEGNDIRAVNRPKFDKAMSKIVLDVASQKVKVGQVYDEEDRKRYLKQFASLRPARSELKEGATDALAIDTRGKPTGASARRASAGYRNRSVLVPASLKLNIKGAKPARLLKELRGLKVADYRNLVAFGLRVFLEISCYEFQKRKKIPATEREELHARIGKCCDALERLGVDREDLAAARKFASASSSHVLSVTTLHTYIHNSHFVPTSEDLIVCWDNLQPLIEGLWTK